jgi:hypothetical protein
MTVTGPPRHLRDTAGDPAAVAGLRRRRVSFEEIAAHLGVSPAQAGELYSETLESLPDFKAGELRAEELLLADDAMRRLMTIAMGESTSPRTAVEAWNGVRGWAEHKARLLGLEKTQPRPETGPSRLDALRQARRA